MKNTRNLLLFLTIVFSGILTPAKGLVLTKKKEQYNFYQNISFFCDRSSTLTIQQINSTQYLDSFLLVGPENRIMKDPGVAYWIRIPLLDDHSEKQWLLEFFDFRLLSLQLFNEQNKVLSSVSHYQPFEKRNFAHKNFVFALPLKKEGVTVYYARITVDKTSYLSGRIRSYENFLQYSNEEYFFLALFYGILLTLLLYNMIVYISIRDASYVYYSLYILFIGFLVSSRDGIGFQFLWHDLPLINKYLFPVAETALVIFAGLYAIQFLDLKKKDPLFYQILRAILVMRLFVWIIGWALGSNLIYTYEYDLLPLLLMGVAGIRAKKRGYQPANFYLAGFGFVVLGFVINLFIDKNILASSAYTFYSLNAGVIIESFFLSMALGSKLQTLHQEKEKNHRAIIEQMKVNEALKEKVTRELEEKVQQRTQDLQEKTEALLSSNEKLQALTEQLNEMNARLDRDNWKLNQDVKEKTKEQIISKELSYLQFSEVFPDELSCLRYLDEIKWKDHYHCKKCGHSKYSEGEIKFSRKCTRCDYIESVKAHTIFQGVKFPLQKSFYILYLMTNSKRKITLKELSETLELRMNTCSVFRGKVELKKKRVKTERWEELVLDDRT